ncbi:radical SAM domain-containing protein [Gottschalkia acidurici 9a]|uniref:Radical SAM domain-containing protein n=1 Tax=Gottschalkia acidurici (strain ATCC 7906 / DSM 604 / BCRC 14475 / CIP 104303 / KCTC 5404 / NCIMB 10678 / 9a) TaxID=1128398 RepID=K0AYK7_GOTA9|nr:radical SAM protein [Gottschalkia acidurici]AFS77852.1 radical SAM domain-containing protein [Gottschalkia acidurici 9a]
MFHTIDINKRKYLFLPNSLFLFDFDSEIMQIANDIGKIDGFNNRIDTNNKKVIKDYLEKDKKAEQYNKEFINKFNSSKIRITGCEINVFYGCNLACKYCFACDGGHGKQYTMTKEIARKTIDYILDNSEESPKIKVTIIGGEPLLNMSAFKEIIEYGSIEAKKRNKKIYFATTTNGTLLDANNVNIFEKHNIPYMVSLDSHIKETNDYLRPGKNGESSYDDIMSNWPLITKTKKSSVHVTVTPHNKNIFEIAQNLFDQGVYHIHFFEVKTDNEDLQFTVDDIEYLKKEYEKLSDLIIQKITEGKNISCYPLLNYLDKLHYKKPVFLTCGTFNNRVSFAPDGNIYPCDMLMWDKYKIGNINEGIYKDRIIEIKELLNNEDNCEECWARYLCGGECLADKLWENKEQKALRCDLKRHVLSLKLYIYDYIVKNFKDFDFNKY